MADEPGQTTELLIGRLAAHPEAFDFFAAMRLLERSRRDLPRLGAGVRGADDPVRLGQEPSMAFAASTIRDCQPGEDGQPPKLRVNFFGMFGPHGPLPLHLTDYARQRLAQHDPTFSRFADMFHHRFISLFYRAWAAGQVTVSHDRAGDDWFARFTASLCGLGTAGMAGRDHLPDQAKLFYAGRLGARVKNAEGLESILRDFFQVRVKVISFVRQWLELPADSCCRLGASPESGTLGRTLVVGSRVRDCRQKFRIRMGPMNLDDYRRLLPGGAALAKLRDWVRQYIGYELDWDVQLVLRRDHVPATRLGMAGNLGWTTWMGGRPHERDADELVLQANRG